MVHGIVIPAEAEQPVVEYEFHSLAGYQGAVDGRIEAVDLPVIGATIYVNDEGLLRHLPFNSRASFLWWYHVREAQHKAMLVGDAVLVGLPDRNGNTTDLPTAVRKLLLVAAGYKVEVRTFGDPKWYSNQAKYTDYWDALIGGMVLLERWTAAEDVRVVPIRPRPLADNSR